MESPDQSQKYSVKQVLWDFARENQSTLGTYFLLSLAFPINDVVLPYYYGQVIDQASRSQPSGIWKNTRRSISIIVGLWILKQILISKLDSLDAVFLPRLQSYIRKTVVIRVLEAYKGNYKDPEVGRLLTQITKLPYVIRDLFHQVRYFVLPVILVVLATLGYLFYVHPHLGIIYLAGIVGFLGLVYWFCCSCFHLSARKEKVHLQLNEDITDLLANMLNVYSADTIEEEMIRFEKKQEELDRRYEEAVRCAANFKTIFNIAYMGIFSSLNGYAFYLYSKKKVSLGSLSSVLIVTLYVIGMLESASREIRDFAANIGVLQRAQKAINALGIPPLEKETFTKVPDGEIVIKDLEVSYSSNPNETVLRVPYLRVGCGETVAVVGRTGCGKSTLAKVLVKLLPYRGTILVDGKDIRSIDCQDLRRKVIYVPQQPRLFNRSVLENITYGSRASREDVINTIRGLDIGQITEKDLDRSAGKNGDQLSGGQRQIVYFLRFLFRDGSVIILDEPTSALDEKSRSQILRILRYLSQGRTTIVITHDPEVMRFASRRIQIEDLKHFGS